jgi:hypothetical protein
MVPSGVSIQPFNADPDSLRGRVENPERIHVLAPGEPFELRRLAT